MPHLTHVWERTRMAMRCLIASPACMLATPFLNTLVTCVDMSRELHEDYVGIRGASPKDRRLVPGSYRLGSKTPALFGQWSNTAEPWDYYFSLQRSAPSNFLACPTGHDPSPPPCDGKRRACSFVISSALWGGPCMGSRFIGCGYTVLA